VEDHQTNQVVTVSLEVKKESNYLSKRYFSHVTTKKAKI